MRFFRNLSIKKKLSLIALLTCVTALTLVGVGLLIKETSSFRRSLVNELSAQARMLAGLSTAALTFEDKTAADQLLAEFANQDQIEQVVLFHNGKVFTSFRRPGVAAGDITVEPAADGEEFRAGRVFLHRRIMMKEERIGTVFLVANTRALNDRLWQFGVILSVVFAASTSLALLLTFRLQAAISSPVMNLALVADAVAANKDYSLRAEKLGEDEVGRLTESFNEMLKRIESQDAALTLSQQKTQALINSLEGIVWECTPETFHFTFVSQQSERILGYTPAQWSEDPNFWHNHVHPDDSARAIQSCHDFVKAGKPYSYEYRMLAADGRVVWIRESGSVLFERGKAVAVRGIFFDVTAQKEAAQELDQLNRRLLETSRMAGMAEVATGVLHNVGNVLNSVGVSANIVGERLKQSKITNLRRAAALFREKDGQLAEFITNDPKGKLLPNYLVTATEQLSEEHRELVAELSSLTHHIEHIKEIVAMQQSYAKVSGAFENLPPEALIEDALRMNAAAFDRHRIQVVREVDTNTPPVCVDRHKVLQILINLLRNAKYAMDAQSVSDKRLVVRANYAGPDRVQIAVSDNGCGISPENLVKIFNHGFTTKKDGHGFGLHSGANAAKQMGGSLSAHSDGPGKGATFILELPVAKQTTAISSVDMDGPGA